MASQTHPTPGRPLSYLATLPVDVVKGIGPALANRLSGAGLRSVADLLLHVPRRYLDRSQMPPIARVPLGEEVTVAGVVESVDGRRLSRNRKMTTIVLSDGTGRLTATFWNPYVRFTEGREYALSGKVERWQGKLQMKSPDSDPLDGESLVTGRVVPVHPGIAKLAPFKLRGFIDNALRRSRPVHEVLPDDILRRNRLVPRDTAIADIHFPERFGDVRPARKRLVFDEFFRLELALALRKKRQRAEARGVSYPGDGSLVADFVAALPFRLTGAQQRAIAEIADDQAAPHPMHRLLIGEVGSGKTVVAVAALLTAVQSGHQGAVMAPTEVLAVQHYLGIADLIARAGMAPAVEDPSAPAGMSGFFDGAAGYAAAGVTVGLLTSNTAEVNFRPAGTTRGPDLLEWIAAGKIDMVVGTHALIQDGVHFPGLAVAVVDEQHRFGVHQRVQLKEKVSRWDPDLLIMTATPIPRTLSMTLYGDLDVSEMDEMPGGKDRPAVRTLQVSKAAADLEGVYDLVRSEAAAGRQAFVVCPLVEDSDKLEVASATAEFERLREVFPDLRLGLLHGQLRPQEKDDVMHRLRSGELDVLVATTVIEVGIDIPNASVMVIEDADRFGLSQLHQLRGRVGRGRHPGTCVLVAEPTTDDGLDRIEAMVSTTDGFELAEKDLEIRGQGTVFGARQAGMADLKLGNILRDRSILEAARRDAFALVDADPDPARHPELREEIQALLGEEVAWLFLS